MAGEDRQNPPQGHDDYGSGRRVQVRLPPRPRWALDGGRRFARTAFQGIWRHRTSAIVRFRANVA